MTVLLRILLIVCAFFPLQAWASGPSCGGLFAPPNSINFESVLERAGKLEENFKEILAQSHDRRLTQDTAERLHNLEILIQDLLSGFGAERLPDLIQQLDDIAKPPSPIEDSSAIVETSEDGPRLAIQQTKQASKDLERLQYYLVNKYQSFLQEVSRISKLSELSPTWALERIKVIELTKDTTYTVRLNDGYRVLFSFDDIHGVKIYRISMKVTHDGH